eukprot:1161184-Pelagomonas_calceolata.AAC.7
MQQGDRRNAACMHATNKAAVHELQQQQQQPGAAHHTHTHTHTHIHTHLKSLKVILKPSVLAQDCQSPYTWQGGSAPSGKGDLGPVAQASNSESASCSVTATNAHDNKAVPVQLAGRQHQLGKGTWGL